MTVKTDGGAVQQVQVPTSAVLKRIEPGQRDLSAAVTITLNDLEPGDRVLVRLAPSLSGNVQQAQEIITIKRADVALKQQKEREAWQTHGVGGLVKSVDPAAGTIELTTGAGPTMNTITIHVTKATVLKRYAPASVRFDLAQPAPMDAIHVGDQLRARGEKNAAGTELTADEIVSGSFRNISGRIASLNVAQNTITVKDLSTKKDVTVEIPPDAQMHSLTEAMARMLAKQLKGKAQRTGNGQGAQPAGQRNHWNHAEGGKATRQEEMHPDGSEMQQVLSRAPTITFADLKKGQVVMLVSTAGKNDVTAITLLTGVEPLLEAPEASSNLLSNWSMGSGGAGATDTQ